MSRPQTERRHNAGGGFRAPVASRLACAVSVALAAAGTGVPAAGAGHASPPRPQAAVTEPSAGAQPPPAGAVTTDGTTDGQTPPAQPVDGSTAPDAPVQPAATDADDVFDPLLLVGPPEPPWLFGPPAPGIEELVAGFYVMAGGDGNRVARVTSEGIVVAGELTPAAESLVALLDGVTDQPVRYVLATQRHGHEPAHLPAVWRNAKLVAPERQEDVPARDGAQEPPDLAFTSGLSLFLGEAEVQVHHFAPAHTATDAVVLFPDLGMLYVGDLVFRNMPFIDYLSGGSSRGWVETLNGILALDFETAIPGSGPALTKRDVQVFRDRLVTLRMRAMQLLYRNLAREEALSLLQTTDLDWPLAPEGPFASQSFAALYDELAVERVEAREAAAAEAEDAVDETGARPGGR